MRDGPGSSSLISSGALLIALVVGCREFSVCGRASSGCDASGVTGEAGTRGTIECTEPILSCDESSLNGCETDTRSDPLHCGSCGTECDHACGQSRCLTIDELADDKPVLSAGIAASTDHVYFLAASSTGQTVMRRVAKQNGAISTVQEGLNRDHTAFSGLTVGLDRVYFVEGGDLFSVGLSDQKLVSENVHTYVSPLTNGHYLYVWTTGGSLLRRDLSSAAGDEEIEPWAPDALQLSLQAEIELSEGPLEDVVVGTQLVAESEPRWELRSVRWPHSTSIARGTGELGPVRTLRNSEFEVVWLVREPEAGGSTTLHGYDGLRKEDIVIATERTFVDFCLDGSLIYAYLQNMNERGLRVMSRTAPSYAEIGFRYQIAALLCDDGSAYFFDGSAPGLFRVTLSDLLP